MKMIHELKCWPEHFDAVMDGSKTFEVRRDDRWFSVGDILDLRRWEPTARVYTGQVVNVRVCYILTGGNFGIEPGYVILGIEHTCGSMLPIPEPPKPTSLALSVGGEGVVFPYDSPPMWKPEEIRAARDNPAICPEEIAEKAKALRDAAPYTNIQTDISANHASMDSEGNITYHATLPGSIQKVSIMTVDLTVLADPCPDCTAEPGWYVGLTSRRPCPTCSEGE